MEGLWVKEHLFHGRVISWTVYLLCVFGTQTCSSNQIRRNEVGPLLLCSQFSVSCLLANTSHHTVLETQNSKVSVVDLGGACLHYFLYHKSHYYKNAHKQNDKEPGGNQ